MNAQLFKRLICAVTLVAFVLTSVAPVYAQSALQLPAPGTMLGFSAQGESALMSGIQIDLQNPFQCNFLIQRSGQAMEDTAKRTEYQKLIKYFLASLTIPNEDMWVNLSPYESGRIIPDQFGLTEMGRDLLAQDYLLKQLTASALYPDGDLGKKYWAEVYQKATAVFGTTDVPLDTFNKVWILPDKAVIYQKDNTAVIVESHLKVMLEADYLAMSKASDSGNVAGGVTELSPSQKIAQRVVREVVLPLLEKEVNEGENFAQLRQVYSAMITATWFKKALRESLLGRVYADRNKVNGINLNEPGANEAIYKQYLEAYKKGAFNLIREERDALSEEMIPRKYFSGGMKAPTLDSAQIITDLAEMDAAQKSRLKQASGSDMVQARFRNVLERPRAGITGVSDSVQEWGKASAVLQAPKRLTTLEVRAEDIEDISQLQFFSAGHVTPIKTILQRNNGKPSLDDRKLEQAVRRSIAEEISIGKEEDFTNGVYIYQTIQKILDRHGLVGVEVSQDILSSLQAGLDYKKAFEFYLRDEKEKIQNVSEVHRLLSVDHPLTKELQGYLDGMTEEGMPPGRLLIAVDGDRPDAFAIGGTIVISMSLIRQMKTVDEVAAVLAHEQGHVRETMRGRSTPGLFSELFQYRTEEIKADVSSPKRLARIGFAPDALREALLGLLSRQVHTDAVHGDQSDRILFIDTITSSRGLDMDVRYLSRHERAGRAVPAEWLLKAPILTLEEQILQYPVGLELKASLLSISLERLKALGEDLMEDPRKMDFVLQIVAQRLGVTTQDPVAQNLRALAFFSSGFRGSGMFRTSEKPSRMSKYLLASSFQKKFIFKLLRRQDLEAVLQSVADATGPNPHTMVWLLSAVMSEALKAVVSDKMLSRYFLRSNEGTRYFKGLRKLFLRLGQFCSEDLIFPVLSAAIKVMRGDANLETLKIINEQMQGVPGWDKEMAYKLMGSMAAQRFFNYGVNAEELWALLNQGIKTVGQTVIASIHARDAEALFAVPSWNKVVNELREDSIKAVEDRAWLREQIKGKMLAEQDPDLQFKLFLTMLVLISNEALYFHSKESIREVVMVLDEPAIRILFERLPTATLVETFLHLRHFDKDASLGMPEEISSTSLVTALRQRVIADIMTEDFKSARILFNRTMIYIGFSRLEDGAVELMVGRSNAEAQWLLPLQRAYADRVLKEIGKVDLNVPGQDLLDSFDQVDRVLVKGAMKERVMERLARVLILRLDRPALKMFIQKLVDKERMTLDLADFISAQRIKTYGDYQFFENIVETVVNSLDESIKKKGSAVFEVDTLMNDLKKAKDYEDMFSAAMGSQEDGFPLQEMFAPLWYASMTGKGAQGLVISYKNGKAEIGGPNPGAFVPFDQFMEGVYKLSDAKKMLIMKKILLSPDGVLSTEKGRNMFAKIVRSRLPQGEGLEKVLRDILTASVSELDPEDIFKAFVSPLLPLFMQKPKVPVRLKGYQLKRLSDKVNREKQMYFARAEARDCRSLFQITQKKPSGEFYEKIVSLDLDINRRAAEQLGLELNINADQDFQGDKNLGQVSAMTIVLNVARNLGATGVRFLQVISQYMRLSPEQAEEFRKVYDENPGQNSFIAWATLSQAAKEDVQVKEFLEKYDVSLERVLGRGSMFTAFLIHVRLQDDTGQDRVEKMVLKVRNPNMVSELKKVTGKAKRIIVRLQQMNRKGSAVVSRMTSGMLKWVVRQGLERAGVAATGQGKMAQRMLGLMSKLESTASKKARNYEIAYAMMEQIYQWNMGDLEDAEFSRLDPLYFSGHHNTQASNGVTIRIPGTQGLPNNAHVRVEAFVEGVTLNKNFKEPYVVATVEHFAKSLVRPLYLNADGNPVFVIHSDLHPGNVMVSGEKEITIIDRNYYLEFSEKEVGLLRRMLSGGQDVGLLGDIVGYILDAPENKERLSTLSARDKRELMSRIMAGVAVGQKDPMSVFNVISQEIVAGQMTVPLKLRIFLKEIISLEGMLKRLPGQHASLGTYIEQTAVREAGGERTPLAQTDQAQTKALNPGGIDLNEKHLDLEIRRDGNGAPLVFAEQPASVTDIPGLVPEIMSISSGDAATLPVFSQ